MNPDARPATIFVEVEDANPPDFATVTTATATNTATATDAKLR